MTESRSAYWIAVALLALTFLVARTPPVSVGLPTSNGAPALNLESLGERWRCSTADREASGYRDPNVDLAWHWVCEPRGGPALETYVGYLATQRQQKRILSPVTNYPEGDDRWSYVSREPLELFGHDRTLPPLRASRLVFKHSSGHDLAVVYWYQLGESSFSSEYLYRLALFGRRLMRRTTEAAVVRIAAPAEDYQLREVLRDAEELAELIYPAIQGCFAAGAC